MTNLLLTVLTKLDLVTFLVLKFSGKNTADFDHYIAMAIYSLRGQQSLSHDPT